MSSKMTGCTRSELSSSSPEGSSFAVGYPNGQRGSYSSTNLERSGSFRESLDNRMLSTGAGATRILTPVPPMEILSPSQSLMLEPLSLGDQKNIHSGELRRILGVFLEEHSFGSVQSKLLPPAASEELKRFKASVLNTVTRTRERAKLLHESIVKLDKYRNLLSRKRQRNEIPSGEKLGGANSLKMGSQIHQNPSDFVAQRLEERTKNIVPNKRMRSSVVEVRSEGRAIVPPRQGPVVDKDKNILMDKDKNMLRACNGGLVPDEDKIRGLPAGGDGWEKKMKRKRSVGTVVTRTVDGDREFKQVMQQRLNNEPRPRTCDGLGFRPGSSSGIIGTNKNDSTSQLNGASTRTIPRNDFDNISLPNDQRERTAVLDKERSIAKGSNKLNIREDTQIGSQSPLTKGKASRAPRTGSSAAVNSSSNFPRTSGGIDGWEQTPCLNKVQSLSGTNHRKRPLPTGSSSPPVAQWGGQRQYKMTRHRRTNLVSPVSNHDEAPVLAEGFPAPGIGVRLMSTEAGGPLLSRGITNNTQQLKLKPENVLSPAGLSESEESGAVENKSKEKGIDNGEVEDGAVNAVHKVSTFILPTKKNKIPFKEEIGDGVQRQGRSGRGSALSKAGLPLTKEKMGNIDTAKPLRSGRPGSDISRVGRPPSKKASDRKAFIRPGHSVNSCSSELIGESDDDSDELLAAANSARNASYHACSSALWKKMEQFFSFVSSENIAFLKQQINFAEELDKSLCSMLDVDHSAMGELVHQAVPSPQTLVSGEREAHPNLVGMRKSVGILSSVNESQQVGAASGKLEAKRWFENVIPLSQRLLAAFIEDVPEMFDCETGHENSVLHSASDYSPYGTTTHVNCEAKEADIIKSEFESEMDFMTRKNCSRDNSCNGYSASSNFGSSNVHNLSYTDELLQENNILPRSQIGVESGQDKLDRTPIMCTDLSGSPYECQYEHRCLDDKILMELQNIGLYPDTVPSLAEPEGEDEEIDIDISILNMKRYQEVRRKKSHLCKLDKAVQNERGTNERKLEQIAMDKLIEIAYRKYLGCRGSHGSSNKSGVNKVSKQLALAFAERTLDKCRKFEDCGRSCFSEPTFRDILFSAPLHSSDGVCAEAHNCQHESQTSAPGVLANMIEKPGPISHKLDRGSLDSCQGLTHLSDQTFAKQETISNRGKKREVLLDDVGGAVSRATSTLGNSLPGGAKGKRSERERDQNTITKNSVPKAGRPSLSSLRGERKTKAKPKQKTTQLSISGNGLLGRLTNAAISAPTVLESCETTNSGSSKGNEVPCFDGIAPNLSKETEETIDFTNLPLEEFDVSAELCGQGQDIGSWLNVDEDALQDNDLMMGLEIPMDDLSELNMNF